MPTIKLNARQIARAISKYVADNSTQFNIDVEMQRAGIEVSFQCDKPARTLRGTDQLTATVEITSAKPKST